MAKMINCKSCGKEIASDAKTCPGCGAKNKKPFYKRVWFWVIIAIVVIGVVAGGGSSETSEKSSSNDNSSNSEKTSTNDSSSKKEKFSYTVDSSYVGDYGMGYYIEGFVTNNTDKDYSYVQIEFICYDSDGNNLGTAIDNTNNLLANQTWKYKAMFIGTDGNQVDHCDYHEISSL